MKKCIHNIDEGVFCANCAYDFECKENKKLKKEIEELKKHDELRIGNGRVVKDKTGKLVYIKDK